MNVDVVAELRPDAIEPFLISLGEEFYASEPPIRDAVQRKSCFNLIHFPTTFKVDVFVSRDRPFDQESMARATKGKIGSQQIVEVLLASPEDNIISKLEWYKISDETSQRQWQEVSKVIGLLGERADLDYLRHAAESVAVTELLNRLLEH